MHRTVILDHVDQGRSPAATIEQLMADLRLRLEAEAAETERSAHEAVAISRDQIAALWERCGDYGRALRRLLAPLNGTVMVGGHSLKVIESRSKPPKALLSNAHWLFKLRVCGPNKHNLPVIGMPTDVYVLFNRDPPYVTGRLDNNERLGAPQDVLALVLGWLQRRNTELGEELRRKLELGLEDE